MLLDVLAKIRHYLFKQLWSEVILSGMHPIGQILNFDDQREFQNRGAEHMQTSIRLVDAPNIDENEDSEIVEFIDKYITCALPEETKYPEMSNLVRRVQTHHHTTTCRKKKGVACRFNVPWAPSDKTRIVRSEEKIDETIVKQSKKPIEKVLSYIVTISDLSDVTLSECRVTAEQYDNALVVYNRFSGPLWSGPNH